MSNSNAIEIRNLTKKYKGFILEPLNLMLPSGYILGLIGENGAGKSTTIKMLLDLIKRDSGETFLLGQDSIKAGYQWKEELGVVLDECCFQEMFTLKNVSSIMKRAYKSWEQSTFDGYVKRFGLSSDKTIKEYSRGMKMKLAIAAALSHNAKLLILDEATSGLDPVVRDEILDVFLEFISDEQHSILISSHIISDLEKVCDYIAFLHKGKLVFNESKDEILEQYGLLKCTNKDFEQIDKTAVVGYRKSEFGVEALVYRRQLKGDYVVDRASLEDIMLMHIKTGRE